MVVEIKAEQVNKSETIQSYHEDSKHSKKRYAPAPPTMDWATQPDPFRFYDGTNKIQLPLNADNLKSTYDDLYQGSHDIEPQPLNFSNIATLFELSLAISAWKSYGGDSWALRCNPSSGNLHPTEGYLIVPEMVVPDEYCPRGSICGVYHYVSRDHLLEERFYLDGERSHNWNKNFPANTILIGLSSIHWREAWKYGLRALRYCELDTGHGAMAFRYGAAALGWRAEVLTTPGDRDIANLLGLGLSTNVIPEPELPDLLIAITVDVNSNNNIEKSIAPLAAIAKEGEFKGKANVLSQRHMVRWEGIEAAIHACLKPQTSIESHQANSTIHPLQNRGIDSLNAATIIRQRRSGQDYDGETPITKDQFYHMLDACMPRAELAPWDISSIKPAIHPIIFVHRVTGLQEGLYALPRNSDVLPSLQKACDKEFLWSQVDNAPDHLPLYLLQSGDAKRVAKMISCGQDIAADGAFSLGLLAQYGSGLKVGAWGYRRLFWEAGMLGHVLYLEAEAAGVRGTGIGCFLDDYMHELLGLKDNTFQTLYHFTVGTPITDSRLQTIPPYAHLGRG
ncbi:MAG: SagB/ThcOx family dehydrogenase [Magnetococcales bacterium]|nr:SagB/ThcOx family dehydrogenase [Magnetococcales bacterium]